MNQFQTDFMKSKGKRKRRKKKKGDEAPSPPCTHPFGALPILSQHCMQALGTYILWKMHPPSQFPLWESEMLVLHDAKFHISVLIQ